MNKVAYGICSKCSKFGIAPKGFSETRHMLVCCDCPDEPYMYLDYSDPRKAAYKQCDKPIKFVSMDRS
jgi:hypothetical protein